MRREKSRQKKPDVIQLPLPDGVESGQQAIERLTRRGAGIAASHSQVFMLVDEPLQQLHPHEHDSTVSSSQVGV